MTNKPLTLGSLFDGSGGFPLGAIFSGIKPVWASEIEPFPIRVTTKRLPSMRHLGDVSKIRGADIEPVDIITSGSPCTDVSCAGLRAGLDGKQSSLFYQAIRIVKEMREATNGAYPRYFVFENVPGLFSSNKGADFKAVLDAIVQLKEPDAEVPAAPPGGWPYADVLLGDGWSVAYRVIDAQHFGVPQRRKRIYLVADFGSECAGDILFERQGVCRDFASGGDSRETAAGGAAIGAGEPNPCFGCEPGAASRLGGHFWENIAGTLRADAGDNLAAVVYGIGSYASEGMKSANPNAGIYEAETTRTLDQSGGNPACRQGGMAVVTYAMTTGGFCNVSNDIAAPLMARDYKDAQIVNTPQYTARRLTPRECARLQAFPSDWCAGLETPAPTEAEINWWAEVFETHRRVVGTSGKPKSRRQIIKWLQNPHTDTAEYKMWGNGVCANCVCFVLRGIGEAHKFGLESLSE